MSSGGFVHKRRLLAGAGVLVVILLVEVAIHLGHHSGINYTQGLTPTPPTAAQAAAMGQYYAMIAEREPGMLPGTFGCVVVKPLATRTLSGGRFEAYAQMLCAQCPVADSTPPGAQTQEETPVAFVLAGNRVMSAEGADAPGDPMWLDQIKEYFPHQLWGAAQDQVLSSQQNATNVPGAVVEDEVPGWQLYPNAGADSTDLRRQQMLRERRR